MSRGITVTFTEPQVRVLIDALALYVTTATDEDIPPGDARTAERAWDRILAARDAGR